MQTGLESLIAHCQPGWSLPAEFYNDDDVYQLDLEHIWRRGWLFAGHACEIPQPGDYFTLEVGTDPVIVLRAADLGVTLDSLEVKVASQSNDCGMFGVGDDIPAGPLSASMEVQISAKGVDETVLKGIVTWAIAHSPVADALQRTVPLTVATTVN